MNIIPWDVPIIANTNRSNDLIELRYSQSSLILILEEEETEEKWNIQFHSVQAFRSITEECSAEALKDIPTRGGFFKVIDSGWAAKLGKNNVSFMKDTSHYVICCYDEVVEVISDIDDPEITKQQAQNA